MIKKILPHLAALVVFAAISAIFFYPQYQGKMLYQGDMVQAGGMAVDVNQHMAKYGEHPQWMGRMFGGMPSYTTTFNNEGRYIGNNAHWLNILGQPASMLFLAMAGFYLMLIMFGVNPWLAIVGGIAYGLSTYFPIIIGAGHITKMWALQWVAPMIGSIWWAYRRNLWVGAALLGIFASLEIAAYHPQISYYFLFVIFALVVNEFVKSYKEKLLGKFAMRTAVILGAGMLAVGSNFVTLYYTASYAKDSNRGPSELTEATLGKSAAAAQSSGLDKDYATQWSYGIGETFNLYIPNLYGGGRDFKEGGAVDEVLSKYNVPKGYYKNLPSYHGNQPFTEGPVYIGAVMIFLALFALVLLRGVQKWWIVAPMMLAIMLAWGKNMMWLSDLFLDYFPMYNKFRTVSMFLVVVQWAIPFLAILGLQQALKSDADPKRIKKALTVSGCVALGAALFVALLFPGSMNFAGLGDGVSDLPKEIMDAVIIERGDLLRSDAWRTAWLVLASGALLWFYFKGKIKNYILYIGLGVLVTVDMFGVDRRYVSASDFHDRKQVTEIMPSADDLEILQDTTNYRVANMMAGSPFQEARTSRFHRSVGGYNATKMKRYQELIDVYLSKMYMPVYNMLNTKYIINEMGPKVNPGALGNAWFVDTVRVVENADQELQMLGKVDLATTAVVDQRFKGVSPSEQIPSDSTANIRLVDYRVNRLTYNSYNSKERLAVFSEIFYDGWTPYIDGVEASALRVDYVLRGLIIPSGEHQIVWKFAAPHFAAVTWVTRICSLLLIIGALVVLILELKKNGSKQ